MLYTSSRDIAERRPRDNLWQLVSRSPLQSTWRSGAIVVISALEMAELPDRSGVGPQWHISISYRGRRAKPHHARKALRAFGMTSAEEDNHHPGIARHFWLVVDPAHRVECECKTDETTVVEQDGYRWQNAISHCRGCEFERALGRPCSLHAVA